MINTDLITYIKSALAQGLNESVVRKNLTEAGWEIHEIDAAFLEAGNKVGPLVFGSVESSGVSGAVSFGQSSFEADKTSTYVSPAVMEGRNWKKIIIISIGAILFLLIISVGVLFALGYRLIGSSFVNINNVFNEYVSVGIPQIFHAKSKMVFNDDGDLMINGVADLGIKAPSVDIVSEDFFNSSGEGKSVSDINFTIKSSGVEFTGKMQLLLLDKKAFINIQDLPYADVLQKDLESIGAKSGTNWILFDSSSLSSDIVKINSDIKKAFDISKYIEAKEYVGTDVVDGKDVLRYKIIPNAKVYTESFLSILPAELNGKNILSQSKIDDCSVWIDAKGNLSKYSFKLTMPSLLKKDGTGVTEIKLEQTLSKIGEDKQVQIPEEYFDVVNRR